MRKGQAVIMLLLISLMIISLVTTMVAVAAALLKETTILSQGERAFYTAEAGAQEGILRLLRDPSYTGASNLPLGDGVVTIDVTGDSPKIVTSTAMVDGQIRKVSREVTRVSGEWVITNWRTD